MRQVLFMRPDASRRCLFYMCSENKQLRYERPVKTWGFWAKGEMYEKEKGEAL